MNNDFFKKSWRAIPLLVLFLIFTLQFIDNFFLARWNSVSIRSIDDFALQSSLRFMQRAIVSGNLGHVFGCFDYAYGNGFWLINSLLLLPLYFLGNEEFIIVIGRQISLIFVFANLYLINLIIERIRPKEHLVKYAILIFVATMPIVATLIVKFHVNPQCIFLGLLSFYLLIREKVLVRRTIVWSAVLAGMAVGFKLTAMTILPLLGLTLLYRLRQQNLSLLRHSLLYTILIAVTATFCTLPMIFAFPFYSKGVKNFFSSIMLFKDMNAFSGAESSFFDSFSNAISPYYMRVATFIAILILFATLLIANLRRIISTLFHKTEGKDDGSIFILFIFVTALTTIFVLTMFVHKPSVWLSTYSMSIFLLWPIGLLGVTALPVAPWQKVAIVYFILGFELISGYDVRRLEFGGPYIVRHDRATTLKLAAIEEVRPLVTPLTKPISVLLDATAVFPLTKFDKGVETIYNYGNLDIFEKSAKFDFIVLSSKEYYPYNSLFGNPIPQFQHYTKINGLRGAELQSALRQILRNSGKFYGESYDLIYDKNDLFVYAHK